MEKLLLTQTDDIFNLIVNCYQTDVDLYTKFHVTPGSLSKCVDRTVTDFLNHNIKIYKLEENGSLIGYFGEEDIDRLTGFFIIPKYRKTHKNLVWNMIKSHFPNDFNTGIYTKNVRAAKFLKKMGGNIVDVVIEPDGFGEIYNFVKENK